jgi:DNA-directed RNA polymerase specialized sigma24 family protein
VLRAEVVRRLTEAVEKLPERLRWVLSLHYIEDLTYREIAIGQLRKLLPDA